MKEIVNCLREFGGLAESEQPSYMLNHGNYITTNAGVFPDLTYDGAAILAEAGKLFLFYSSRKKSELDKKTYEDQQTLCNTMMDSNYDGVDFRAQGDGDIVALAGIKGTSQSTAKTAAPGKAKNPNLKFVDNVGDILLSRDTDKLALFSVTVSCTDVNTKITKSGEMQLKIVGADGKIVYVDLSTRLNTLISNQIEGTKIYSAIGLLNPNGMSPLAFPETVIIPR